MRSGIFLMPLNRDHMVFASFSSVQFSHSGIGKTQLLCMLCRGIGPRSVRVHPLGIFVNSRVCFCRSGVRSGAQAF